VSEPGGRPWWDEQGRLWKELVPRSGQAPTVQGELIRCTGKLTDEAYRNGNTNWGPGFERMLRFVGSTLDDPLIFSPDERSTIRDAVTRILTDVHNPDVSGHGSPHYLLTEMAVRWCLAHPDPIPRSADPGLGV
jgi:hypothetical protein